MQIIGMFELIKELPKQSRQIISWLVGIGLLLFAGYSARAVTVDRQEFYALSTKVEQNIDEIQGLKTIGKVSLCLDVAQLEGDNHRVCLFTDTRDRYLDRVVDMDTIPSLSSAM